MKTTMRSKVGLLGGLLLTLSGLSTVDAIAASVNLWGTSPAPTWAASNRPLLLAQRADPVEVDWDAARRRLERQVDANPNDGPAWQRLCDALMRLNRPDEALRACRRAQALGVTDEDLSLRVGDLLKVLGRNGEAYREFERLMGSRDPDRRLTACQQVQYLAPYRFKRLTKPYFADLDLRAGHQSVASVAYIDATARWGVNLRAQDALQLYAVARVTRDNRSGLVGDFPLEYADNVAVLGAGLRYKPVEDLPLYLTAEVGRAADLVDLNLPSRRSDVRAGVSYYQEWFTERACGQGLSYPMRFVLALSGESVYRSRYRDAVITTFDVRPGVRLVESEFSSLDLAVVGIVYADSKADRLVQYRQAGLALSWVPDARHGFKLVGEALRTRFATGRDDTNVIVYLVYTIGL